MTERPPVLVNVGASTGEYWVELDRLRALLAAQGLCVVSLAHKAVCDAMTRTPCYITDADGWAVLNASNQIPHAALRRLVAENGGCLADWARAELARREVKP